MTASEVTRRFGRLNPSQFFYRYGFYPPSRVVFKNNFFI